MRIALVFCLVAASADAAYPDSEGHTLLKNGSFEIDGNGDGWPDGWAKPKSGGSWESDGQNHFLRLKSAAPGETVLLYQPLKLPPDVRAVELAWRWRASDLKPGKQAWFDARLMLEFKDAAGTKLSGNPAAQARPG